MIETLIGAVLKFFVPALMVFLGVCFVGFIIIMLRHVYVRTKKLIGVNCLYWKHGDNTINGNDTIEKIHLPTQQEFIKAYFIRNKWQLKPQYYALRKNGKPQKHGLTEATLNDRIAEAKEEWNNTKLSIPDNAPHWKYREAWWQFIDVNVIWVYEDKVINGESGEISYPVKIFAPEEHTDTSVTTTELAEDIEWGECKPVYKFKTAMLEKASQFGIILLGLAAVGGTFMLAMFLQ